MLQTQHHFSVFIEPNSNVRPNFDDDLFSRLEVLSEQDQWILFTSECPKLSSMNFASSNINQTKVVQMKPSHTQSELQIVVRAIKSRNASAIVASSKIGVVDQVLLKQLAFENECEVFFV
ncbi:SulA-like leucine-rich domain-containing protein [Vibrio sp. S4M6]|uniref:SulA-like leucine-rich domain-containing protein n=1 Tax=Vibrio sinus TaxID=2946865 RepID=UPI002029B6B8|nr:SulA-like leucine-rich domain-containing protein [Vibrio sinus]MCL9783761.1 SulA-like leucine-rich domain-containing protein [Vibrio sinus]